MRPGRVSNPEQSAFDLRCHFCSAVKSASVRYPAGPPLREIAVFRTHEEFRQGYARARELQAMRWAEEVLSIADDGTLYPQDRRIRVDTRKWLLSKMLPRIYGGKVNVAGDPKAPLHHVVEVVDWGALSDAEPDALEAFTDARLAAKDVEDRD